MTGLTLAHFNQLNRGRQFTASRMLIKKVLGKTIPGITEDFPASIVKYDGGGYPAPNTAGEDYKQIIRDTGGKRNRTIILHNNQMSELYNAVVSIIDHKTNEIFAINRSNSAGWPSTYNIVPDNILFDDKANKLYISVPALASKDPVICCIDCATLAFDDPLENCFKVAEIPTADRWACTLIQAPVTYTRGTVTTYPAAPYRSHFKLIAMRGGKLYVWYESNQGAAFTSYPGTATDADPEYRCNQFGYFNASGVYTVLWTYGCTNDHANVPAQLTERNMGTLSFGNYINQMYWLTSWHYTEFDGLVSMVFNTPQTTAPGAGWGIEPTLLEISLDDCSPMWDIGPTIDFVYHVEDTFGFIADIGHPGHFAYYETANASAMSTNYDHKFDITQSVADVCHQMSVYIEWEYQNGLPDAAYQYYLRIETAAHGVYTEKPSNAPFSPDGEGGGKAVEYLQTESGNCHKVINIDPKDPWIRVIALVHYDDHYQDNIDDNSEIKINIYARPHPIGVTSMVSVLSPVALSQVTDLVRPAPIQATRYSSYLTNGFMTASDSTVDGGEGATVNEYVFLTPKNISSHSEFYYLTVTDSHVGTADVPAGMYIINKNGKGIKRILKANSQLSNDNIYLISHIDKTGESGSFLVVSSPALPTTTNNIQLFDTKLNTFAWDGDAANAAITSPLKSIEYDGGFQSLCNIYEIWYYKPGWTTSTDPRTIREWWDGTSPDLIIGAGPAVLLADDGRIAGIESLSFSHSKGESSYELQFGVTDVNYLPWVQSLFNENLGAPGTFTGTLEDGNCILLQRGILNENSTYTWLDECQVFIVSEPAQTQEGIATMRVTCKGIIGNILTRSIYEFVHEPDTQAVAAGVLTADPTEKIFTYLVDGDPMTDWAMSPEVTIYIDGVKAYQYNLNTAAGTVTFDDAQTGKVITADFTYYVPGTNEAEDIIVCILRQANEKGGPGLDDTYFTDNILLETLTTTDNLTYAFSKNNIRNPDDYNAIYANGVEVTTGFTWDYKEGTVTFTGSQAANTITGSCTYFTIQKTGITLRKIIFNVKTQRTAYDCINEIVRRVTPNYILHEAPNGKIIADYYTQKAAGLEDFIVDDDDIILTTFADNPAYYGIANYVISLGQAPLSELPNRCQGRTVTGLWPYGWDAGDYQTLVDGDPATQISATYQGWDDALAAVQAAVKATGVTGLPIFSIDLGAIYDIETIIFARGEGIATEGDDGSGGVAEFSIWISSTGATWKKIIAEFKVMPGQNVQFKAGTNFDEGTQFKYIRVHSHGIGLFKWKGKTKSEINISELQCYESEIIRGEAKLQIDDPAAAFYDTYGMLAKYGYLTHIARNGQPDPALYSQSAVDGDAGDVLNEMLKMLSQVQIDSSYLPGIPLFSTIKIVSAALQRTATMFIETKSISDNGDSFTGSNYP